MLGLLMIASGPFLVVAGGSPTQCYKDGVYAPCGPGNDQCGPPTPPEDRPVFHIKDLSCSENDPNFPFYDEVHGMYHLFYQDHLYMKIRIMRMVQTSVMVRA